MAASARPKALPAGLPGHGPRLCCARSALGAPQAHHPFAYVSKVPPATSQPPHPPHSLKPCICSSECVSPSSGTLYPEA